jgi:hypothetical protein
VSAVADAVADAEADRDIAPDARTDPSLARQMREAWRRGDWEGLGAVAADALSTHPERPRLLALRAAARLALGQHDGAREDAVGAQRAGCDAVLLRCALVASVHDTLARAAAASPTQRPRALHHFREALMPAGSHPNRARWVETRVRHRLAACGLAKDADAVLTASAAPGEPPPWKPLQDALQQAQATWSTQVKALGDQVAGLQRVLDNTVRQELTNAVAQVEAHANLQSYLAGQPLVPRLHGWPISPDFAMLMVDMIEANAPDAVIEFGSGASTVLIAHALQRVGARDGVTPLHLSFDHLPLYCEQTAGMLRAAGLRDAVRLCLAPLVPMPLHGGESRPCYSGGEALDALARDLDARLGRPPRLLIVVDGPPGTTGPKARYPVLELVHRSIPHFDGHVLLDDYARADERAVAADWCAYLGAHGIDHHLREVPLEKSACVITVAGSHASAKVPA